MRTILTTLLLSLGTTAFSQPDAGYFTIDFMPDGASGTIDLSAYITDANFAIDYSTLDLEVATPGIQSSISNYNGYSGINASVSGSILTYTVLYHICGTSEYITFQVSNTMVTCPIQVTGRLTSSSRFIRRSQITTAPVPA